LLMNSSYLCYPEPYSYLADCDGYAFAKAEKTSSFKPLYRFYNEIPSYKSATFYQEP
jgi:hypothetical protein